MLMYKLDENSRIKALCAIIALKKFQLEKEGDGDIFFLQLSNLYINPLVSKITNLEHPQNEAIDILQPYCMKTG